MRAALSLILSLAIAFSAAGIGTQFPPDDWYAGLVKPSWNPPNWLFGPVWTLLYASMAVAAWRVWRAGARAGSDGWGNKTPPQGARTALVLYFVQLALNAAWSWLFFGLHRPDWSLVEILLLSAVIFATLIAFFRRDRIAGWLLVPYLAWVGFASFLNFTLWRLN